MIAQAVDIYALGVLMWEMCNGQSAWRGMTQSEVPHAACFHSAAFAGACKWGSARNSGSVLAVVIPAVNRLNVARLEGNGASA